MARSEQQYLDCSQVQAGALTVQGPRAPVVECRLPAHLTFSEGIGEGTSTMYRMLQIQAILTLQNLSSIPE